MKKFLGIKYYCCAIALSNYTIWQLRLMQIAPLP